MRCRMRCGDIWRCGGPIKKYAPVDSIGIEGRTQEMTFDSQVPPYSVTYPISISPSDATKKDVRIESNNPSVISVDSVESGQVTFTIHSEGEARVRITSLANADISDEYGVTITAPSQQFSPNNGIFVDVDTEGTATGRKRRTKATAVGDRFTAKVFALDEESEDYVLLEWVHGGDVSKTYVGATNEAYTRAMFTEEVTDKIAREIETLWDNGQIENRFVKFTDETRNMIEQFYSTPLTSESIEELQETLASDEIVTPPDEPVPSCPASIQAVWGNDATIEVGQTAAVITNFTTTAECENVDYSNIVAYVRASYNVPSDVATASIDFNENKVYVTGVKAGECTVVFTDGDRSWSNNVTVTAPTPPSHATISSGSENITLQVNGDVLKTLYYSPSDADTSNITLTNSDSSVAFGQIRDIQAGLITLSIYPAGEGQSAVTVSDGTNSYMYNVTVVGAEPEQGQLMFDCNSREFGSLIGPDGETWDWDTPYTFEPGTQVTYNGGNLLTIGEDVFSLSPVFSAPPESIDIDGNMMEIDVPYELSGTEGTVHIEFYYESIGGDDFNFVDNGEGYYVGNSEFNFNGPSNFVEEGYVVENSDSGTEIENAIVTITGDSFPYYVEVKVPTGDVNPGDRVRVVRRTEEEGWELGEIAGDIPSTQSYTFTINVENLPEGADIDGEIMDGETGEQLGEISVSSFPITIDVWTIDIGGNSHEGDGDININSFKKEGADKNYQINITCDGYKPLFEAVGFSLDDTGDGSYTGHIEAINLDSDVSMTISFTPVEEPEE